MFQLGAEFVRLRRHGLITFEVGYLPFEQDAANLVSSSSRHAAAMI